MGVKTIIVHHKTAFAAALKKYEIESESTELTPKNFPVIFQTSLNDDEEDEGLTQPTAMDMQYGVITVAQAAKLVASVTAHELQKQVGSDTLGTLGVLTSKFQTQTSPAKKMDKVGKLVNIIEMENIESGLMQTMAAEANKYKVGDSIVVNDASYTVTAVNNAISMVDAPATENDGMEEIAEDAATMAGQQAGFPGTGKIPIDMSKMQPEHGIAELADDDHVLDVERAV